MAIACLNTARQDCCRLLQWLLRLLDIVVGIAVGIGVEWVASHLFYWHVRKTATTSAHSVGLMRGRPRAGTGSEINAMRPISSNNQLEGGGAAPNGDVGDVEDDRD
jgi:hypothetical protein